MPAFIPLVVVMLAASSCSFLQQRKKLDPASEEFLSTVRYLITKKERDYYYTLPPVERELFREEFWKVRDPDPYTEYNEFKENFYIRIETANKLFKEGTTPGWLTDRGRIYILLGPPNQRMIQGAFFGTVQERWFYSFSPLDYVEIIFEEKDFYRFELLPRSAPDLGKIMRAAMEGKPKISMHVIKLDFDLDFFRAQQDSQNIQIIVPFENLWMTEKEGRLETTFILSLEAQDITSEETVWEHQKTYFLSIEEVNLEELAEQIYMIEVPTELKPGDYTMVIILENTTYHEEVRKKIKFTI